MAGRMSPGAWDERIARAEELAAQQPAAAQLLHFYARVAEFQKKVHAEVSPRASADPAQSLRSQLRPELVLPFFPALLELVEQYGPGQLEEAARELAATGEGKCREVLMDHVAGRPADALLDFFARALVQPYAEHLAAGMAPGPLPGAGLCPVCGGKPQLGVLRPEGEGARRSLLCSFCLLEWEFRRIVCPACGEEDDKKLAFYRAQEFPHLRVESCDTCRRYLKSVDLAQNGLAVPLVDEVASAPLDLWARDHALTKIALNLLGL